MTGLKFSGDLGVIQGIVFALLISAAAWFLYYRQVKNRPGSSKYVLPSLRAGAIFLLIMMLTQPVFHHRKIVGELGKLFVVVDTSRSMMLKDLDSELARKILSAQSQGIIDDDIVDAELVNNLTQIEQSRMALQHELAGRKSAGFIKEQSDILLSAMKTSMDSSKDLLIRFEKNPQEIEKRKKSVESMYKTLNKLSEKYQEDQNHLTLRTLLRNAIVFEKELRASLYSDIELLIQNNPEVAGAVKNFDRGTRWTRLQNTLFEGQEPLLDILAESHEIELISLKGDEMETLWRSQAGRLDQNAEVPQFLSSTPNTDFTDLASGIEVDVADQKAAVLLLTDGRHNHGEPPVQLAKVLGNKGVKVYPVGYGSMNQPQDLAIQEISTPQSVYLKDKVRGSIIFNDSMKPGQSFNLKMMHEGEVLFEKELVTTGSGLRRLMYDFPVEKSVMAKLDDKNGLKYKSFPLKVNAELSYLEGDRQRKNNLSNFNVMVATRKRSILMIDQRPRWEWRYLKTMFERDSKWEMNAVVPVAGETKFKRGPKHGELPEKKEELMKYDLIIMGDVNKRLFEDQEIEWIKEFVEVRGGGIIFIDGRRNALKSFEKTPMENLIPVKWKSASGKRNTDQLRLTEFGKNHSILELGSEEKTNEDTGIELPKMRWLADVEALPGTEVLVEEGEKEKKTDVIVMRRFGAGKVYYSGAEDFWRWRFKKGDVIHQRLWNQVVGWIMEKPFAVQDKHVAIDAGKTTYDQGDQADIRTRIRDKDGKVMVNAEAEAHLLKDDKVMAKLPLVDNGSGLYTTRTQQLEGGEYKVRVHVKGLDDFDMRAEARFSVKEPVSAEMSQLTCNEKLLQDMAVNSGGTYIREENIRDVVKHLKPLSSGKVVETDTALWQSYWYFLIVIFLFTSEWVWRKRKGMI